MAGKKYIYTELLTHHRGAPSCTLCDVHTHPVYGVLTMETEAVVVVTKYFLTARFHVMIKKQNLGNDGFFSLNPFSFLFVSILGFVS